MGCKSNGATSTFTKMPTPRKNSILRLHLFKTLDQIQTCKVGVVEGIAGSGKTTLLASYFHTRKMEVQWLTINEECNYREVFWTYIRELLTPGEANKCDPMVATDLNATIRSLLATCRKQEHYLVLDNVHLLNDRETIASLSYFLDRSDEHMHVLLCGRYMPDLYLGKQMVEGQFFRIQRSDLLFQLQEELQFLKMTLALDYQEDVLLRMCKQAGGWVGGLQLMVIALAGKRATCLQSMPIGDPYLDSYIRKEIFAYLHPQEQYFLTAISILHSFDIRFLEAYLPTLLVQQLLTNILDQHFIVSVLDDVAHIYCLHDILKEYFVHQFALLALDTQHQLRARAALICEQNGDYQECIYHAVMNKEYVHAMKIICETAQDQKILQYLKQIPIDIICENPDFAYQYFFYYYANFEEEACNRIYRMISDRFHEDPSFAAFRWVSTFLSDAEYRKQPIHIVPYDELMRLPLKKETISFLLIKDAFLLIVQHRSDESKKYMDRVMDIYEETKNIFIGSMLFLVQTQIYEFLGEFRLALQSYQYLYPIVDTLPFQKPTYYVGIAGLYVKQWKLQEALFALQQCDTTNTKQIYGITRAGLYTKAQVYCILHDERAIAIIDTLSNDLLYKNFFMAPSLLRLLYLWKPQHTCFPLFLQGYDPKQPVDFDSMLLYAQLIEAQGDVEKANAIVHEVLQQARKSKNRYSLIEAALFNLHLQLHSAAPLPLLENIFMEAITYASENDIVLPFLFIMEDWPVIIKRMHACIENRMTALQKRFVQNLPIVQKTMRLTQREWEVLQAISTGKSNKEIAATLCISLATVKTHILNIYGKLQVSNRIEATNYYNTHSHVL